MYNELPEVIDAHVQWVALQKPAQRTGQYRNIVEYSRGVHNHAADDRPEIAYIMQENVQRRQEHADAEVNEKQADYRIDQQQEIRFKGDAVDRDENEIQHEGHKKINEMCDISRDQEIELGNGHLAVDRCTVVQNGHRIAGDAAEIVEQQKTREKVNGVVRQLVSEESAEDQIHCDKQQQRRQCAPQNAERRALIFLDKISFYKLCEQKSVPCAFCHMVKSP